MEWMRGDGEPALRMDQLDPSIGGKPGGDGLLEIERQQMPVQRAHLLADHHLHTQCRMLPGELAGPKGSS